VPRVNAEGWEGKIWVVGCEFFHGRPIVLAGGVDDALTDADAAHGGDERCGIAEAWVVKVVVRVDPHVGRGRGCQLAQAAGGKFFGGIEDEVRHGDAAVGCWVVGGHLHFSEGPDVIGHFHDVLDLEFLDEAAIFVVAADFHEGSEFAVDPHVDHFVAAGSALRFLDAEFVAGLAADVFFAFEFRVGPVKKAEREILVGEVGVGDRFDEFVGGEIAGFAVDQFEKVVSIVGEAHVEDAPWAVVFVELELDVFAIEEQSDGCFFTIFGEISLEWFGLI